MPAHKIVIVKKSAGRIVMHYSQGISGDILREFRKNYWNIVTEFKKLRAKTHCEIIFSYEFKNRKHTIEILSHEEE